MASGVQKVCAASRLAAYQLHGIPPPAGSLSAALIACDGFTLENAITLGL